jgi:hypothetical protein
MKHIQTISALFFFPGFSTRSRLLGIFGDPHAQLVTLVRRKKPRCAPVAGCGCLQSDLGSSTFFVCATLTIALVLVFAEFTYMLIEVPGIKFDRKLITQWKLA